MPTQLPHVAHWSLLRPSLGGNLFDGRYGKQGTGGFIDDLGSRARGDACAKRALQRLSDATRFHVDDQALVLAVATASPLRMST